MRPRGATDASVVQLAGPAPAGAVASIGSVAVGLDGGTATAAAKAGKQALTVPSLDGLRAFSFLLVFVAHAGLEGIVPGGFGVTVFFFLSGYLITTLMRQEFERYGDVSLKHFYLRRVLRILPPFYLVLIAATAASAGAALRELLDRAARLRRCRSGHRRILVAGRRGALLFSLPLALHPAPAAQAVGARAGARLLGDLRSGARVALHPHIRASLRPAAHVSRDRHPGGQHPLRMRPCRLLQPDAR